MPYTALKEREFVVCGLQPDQVKAKELLFGPGALQEQGSGVGCCHLFAGPLYWGGCWAADLF